MEMQECIHKTKHQSPYKLIAMRMMQVLGHLRLKNSTCDKQQPPHHSEHLCLSSDLLGANSVFKSKKFPRAHNPFICESPKTLVYQELSFMNMEIKVNEIFSLLVQKFEFHNLFVYMAHPASKKYDRFLTSVWSTDNRDSDNLHSSSNVWSHAGHHIQQAVELHPFYRASQ